MISRYLAGIIKQESAKWVPKMLGKVPVKIPKNTGKKSLKIPLKIPAETARKYW